MVKYDKIVELIQSSILISPEDKYFYIQNIQRIKIDKLKELVKLIYAEQKELSNIKISKEDADKLMLELQALKTQTIVKSIKTCEKISLEKDKLQEDYLLKQLNNL